MKFRVYIAILLAAILLAGAVSARAQIEPPTASPPAGTDTAVAEKEAPALTARLQIPIPFVPTNCTLQDAEGNSILENGKPIPTVCDLSDYIRGVYRLAIGLAALFAVVMIIIGGYQWIFSGGSSDRTGAAKKRIFGAVIGLILALLSYVILNTITPRLVALRLPVVAPVPSFYSTQTRSCNSVDFIKEVLHTPASESLPQSEIDSNKNKLYAYDVQDPEKVVLPITGAECGSSYAVVRGTGVTSDSAGTVIGQCSGDVCASSGSGNKESCVNGQCRSIFLWGEIRWPLFRNRYIDNIDIVPVCNGVTNDTHTQHLDVASFPRYSFPRVPWSANTGNKIAFEVAKGSCTILHGDSTQFGLVLKVELNDDRGLVSTIDDVYAVGKAGCSLNVADSSTPILNAGGTDLSDTYSFKNINFKIIDQSDLFTYEDFERGIPCNLVIDDVNFPPL